MRALESFLWRWKPHTCRLYDPRPVGLQSDSVPTLLNKLGDARIVFVGDSIVTEQYFSLEVGPLPATAVQLRSPRLFNLIVPSRLTPWHALHEQGTFGRAHH